MSFKLEKEMTPIVQQWLNDRGYCQKTESGLLNNCDVVGCFWRQKSIQTRCEMRQKTPIRATDTTIYPWMPIYRELVAIELKLARIADVIYQAKTNSHLVTHSYIAMPYKAAYRALDKAKTAKVGVIVVHEPPHHDKIGACSIILEPTHKKCHDNHHLAESLWRVRNRLPNCEVFSG